MAKDLKYSLILIHDDGKTHRYRISRGFLRSLILISIILPIISGLGLWVGYQAWEEMKIWQVKEQVLQNQILAQKVELEKLTNIESLKQNSSQAADPAPAAGIPKISEPPQQDKKPEASAVVTEPPAPITENEAEAEALQTIDLQQVRLDNVSVRLVEGRRMRIKMDLYNETQKQIGGDIKFYFLSADGQKFALKTPENAFKISKLKKVVTSASVPGQANNTTNASLGVEVLNDDKTVLLRQLYPIED